MNNEKITVEKLKNLLELEIEDKKQLGLQTTELETLKFKLDCVKNPDELDFAIKETEKNVHTFEVVYDFYKNKEQERNLNNDR